MDYISSKFNAIEKYEQLTLEFENWFKQLDYDQVKNEEWYKKQENMVIKHLNKENITSKTEIYESIVPEFGTGYYTRRYDNLICSVAINDKDYYTDLLRLANIKHSGATDLSYKQGMSEKILNADCKRLLGQYEKNIVKVRSVLFTNVNFNSDFVNDSDFKKQLFGVMKSLPTFKKSCELQFIQRQNNISSNKNEISITNNNIKSKSKKTKKSYTKARIGTVILEIFFVLSLILAWQISIYILIASAILLAILIVYLVALKKNGFECTKIFSCCMDVEDEPETEISKDNNLINPRLNKAEKLID